MSRDRKQFQEKEDELKKQFEAMLFGPGAPALSTLPQLGVNLAAAGVNEKKPKRARAGSDPQFDNEEYLKKIEDDTLKGLEAMLGLAATSTEEKKCAEEPAKQADKKVVSK